MKSVSENEQFIDHFRSNLLLSPIYLSMILKNVAENWGKKRWVKFPHSPILHYAFSSFLRENNDKNNTFPLGKQICFAIVWGCTETLPKDVKYLFVSRLANVIQGCFTFFPHPLVVNSCINEDIWSFLVD